MQGFRRPVEHLLATHACFRQILGNAQGKQNKVLWYLFVDWSAFTALGGGSTLQTAESHQYRKVSRRHQSWLQVPHDTSKLKCS